MKTTHLAGVSLAALVLANGAWADVTPEQVWADWQAISDRGNRTMSFDSSAREGDSLVIRGLRMQQVEGEAVVDSTLDLLTLRDMGDGRVEVTSSDIAITSTTVPEEGAPTVLKMLLTQQDALTVASGQPGAVNYDYRMAEGIFRVTEVRQGGETLPVTATTTMTDVTGTWTGGSDEAEAVIRDMDVIVEGESEGVRQRLDYALSGVSMRGMPDQGMPIRPTGTFQGEWSAAYDHADWTWTATDAERTMKGSGTSRTGTLSGQSDAQAMTIDAASQEGTFHLEGAALPGPVDLKSAAAATSFTLPMGEEARPFTMSLDLKEVTASDATWALFDPRGALPRDPAELSLRLSGTMRDAETDAPAEVDSLVVENLELRLAGAHLTGSGRASFDPAPATTPAPAAPVLREGRLDLTLQGGSALIENVAAAGLIPPEQVLGARMMLGMFGRPVEGQPDTVTSTIEMGGGGLTVNGQRLQ